MRQVLCESLVRLSICVFRADKLFNPQSILTVSIFYNYFQRIYMSKNSARDPILGSRPKSRRSSSIRSQQDLKLLVPTLKLESKSRIQRHRAVEPIKVSSPRIKEDIIVPSIPDHSPESLGFLSESESFMTEKKLNDTARGDNLSDDTSRLNSSYLPMQDESAVSTEIIEVQSEQVERYKEISSESADDKSTSVSIEISSSTETISMSMMNTNYSSYDSTTPNPSSRYDNNRGEMTDYLQDNVAVDVNQNRIQHINKNHNGDNNNTVCCNLL